jgi:hypothetical protein
MRTLQSPPPSAAGDLTIDPRPVHLGEPTTDRLTDTFVLWA